MMPGFLFMNALLSSMFILIVFVFVRVLTAKPEEFDYPWIKPVSLMLGSLIVIPIAIAFIFLWLPR